MFAATPCIDIGDEYFISRREMMGVYLSDVQQPFSSCEAVGVRFQPSALLPNCTLTNLVTTPCMQVELDD